MDGALVVDLVVVLTLVSAAITGWARGFGRTIGALAGAVAGALLALTLVVPWVRDQVTGTAAPVLAALVVSVLCIVGGTALGSALGGLLHRGLRRLRLGWLDALGGALGGLAIGGTAWVVVAALVPAIGSAPLTDSVGAARSMQTLSQIAPDELQDRASLAGLLERSQPWLAEVAGSPAAPPSVPDVDVDSAAIRAASASVVRVSGDAAQCRNVVTGSGFVVGPDRVMTNAHVVAGVDSPVVRAPGELPTRGEVVYVDETNDLAVIATDGLDAPPLTLRSGAQVGGEGVVAGYPLGGPLQLGPAELGERRSTVVTTDGGSRLRAVLTVAADVEQGSSGGPVLGADGRVVGVVFAKASDVDRVAYAVPASVAAPVVERATPLVTPVATGTCRAA